MSATAFVLVMTLGTQPYHSVPMSVHPSRPACEAEQIKYERVDWSLKSGGSNPARLVCMSAPYKSEIPCSTAGVMVGACDPPPVGPPPPGSGLSIKEPDGPPPAVPRIDEQRHDFPWLDGDGPTYGPGICEMHQLSPSSHGVSPVWTAYARCTAEQVGTLRCWGNGARGDVIHGDWSTTRWCFRSARMAPAINPRSLSTPCTYRGVTKECAAFYCGAPLLEPPAGWRKP